MEDKNKSVETPQDDDIKNEEENETLENNEDKSSQEESSEEDSNDAEALKKKYEEELERRQKAEEAIKRSKYREKQRSLQDKKTPESSDEIEERLSKIEQLEKKRKFQDDTGLSSDVVDKIFSINPNPKPEDLEDPFIKGGISNLQRKKKVEQNTPSSSKYATSLGGKKFNELSKDEQKNAYKKLIEKASKE